MNTSAGIADFWAQGDVLTHAVAMLLLAMSATSWYIMLGKLIVQLRYNASVDLALSNFWNADSRARALESICAGDKSGAFSRVAVDAFRAAETYEQHQARGIGAGVDKSDFVARTLQQSIVLVQARLERGLTLLASVGSTAPFVGLFGTVWGIFHALVGLSGATQVLLERVAGPVGEALIMTAGGLLVAIPAVLAYNACTRANRLVMARVEGFAHSLHAYIVGGMRVEGERAAPPNLRAVNDQ